MKNERKGTIIRGRILLAELDAYLHKEEIDLATNFDVDRAQSALRDLGRIVNKLHTEDD